MKKMKRKSLKRNGRIKIKKYKMIGDIHFLILNVIQEINAINIKTKEENDKHKNSNKKKKKIEI